MNFLKKVILYCDFLFFFLNPLKLHIFTRSVEYSKQISTNDIPLFHPQTTETNENVNINEAIDPEMIDENLILAQLNQLREWQESQRKTVLENQLEQQKMLELEKQKLYNLFGLSGNESDLQNDGVCSSESSYFLPCIAKPNTQDRNIHDTPKQLSYTNSKLHYEKPLELHSPSINQLQKIIENIAVRSPKRDKISTEQTVDDIPKRPFLKRGEGLKIRFKISPDAFRLDNLPKYKYAQRMQKHAQKRQSCKQRHQEITTNDTAPATTAAAAAVASIARNGGGVTSEGHQNNTNDKCTQSQAQSKCNNIQPNRLVKQPILKVQQLKLKPSTKAKTAQNSQLNALDDVKIVSHHINQGAKLEQINLPQSKVSYSPATKLLLDTPTRLFAHFQGDEINELKRFVQLEQDFNNSINGAADMDRNRRDENMLMKLKAGVNLSPKHVDRNIDDIEEEDEDDEQQQQSFSSESDIGDELKHVRFMSNAIAFGRNDATNLDSMAAAAVDENDVPIYDVPRTSSPNDKSTDSFQKFKEKLFDRRLKQKFQNRLSVAKDFEFSDLNSNKSDCDDNGTLATVNELNESVSKNGKEMLQERLLSLEHEIYAFREQNNELTKLIREHEMIRLTFDEERRDYQQQMENERVNFEMYMHDQRLKMLNEKAEWEKKAKDARGLNQTEKNELVSLREKCAKYENELSAQEQKHVAAQGRLRAQLRNAEKDLKELRFEVDNLQLENKKLESENMRLRRQSNNTILTEINKSISKLAYSTEHHRDGQYENQKDGIKEKTMRHGVKKCSNKNAHKTVVAKVTSQREPINGNHMRSKSAPNLQQTDSTDVAYELCSSDGENSDSLSHEGDNGHDKSSYFPTKSSNKKQLIRAEDPDELDKTGPAQCADESDTINKSMKRIIENPDGSKDVWYPNGNLKKISADGMFIRMLYFNKDIKETDIKEGIVKYYYAVSDTWQTTYLDGLEIFEYPGGQTEHRYKNGTVEVRYPNGSVRITNPGREKKEGIKEEWKYADGSNAIQLTNGERMLMLPNGQREVHANGHKRREYPDGTVKIVYPDGSQETRYSNGRVRLKNKDGKLIMSESQYRFKPKK